MQAPRGNSPVAYVWEEFEREPELDLGGAIAAEAARTGIDPAELRAQLQGLVRTLTSAGVLTTRPTGEPTHRLRAILADETSQPTLREPADPGASVPRRVAIAGAIGLLIALALQRLPFWVQLEILIAIARAQRPALADTRRLAAAVKRAARRYPGRAECMEQSMAAFIAGAPLGAAPDWCHGGSLLDDSYHAWVQPESVAVDYTDQHGVSLTTMICL